MRNMMLIEVTRLASSGPRQMRRDHRNNKRRVQNPLMDTSDLVLNTQNIHIPDSRRRRWGLARSTVVCTGRRCRFTRLETKGATRCIRSDG
jgi:hypothetical protein